MNGAPVTVFLRSTSEFEPIPDLLLLTGLRQLVDVDATFVGYAGEVFGYWPTDRDAKYRGYEVRSYFKNFSLRGALRGQLDGVFRAAVDKLTLGDSPR